MIVSRTNFIASHTSNRLRVIGLSTALANAKDLADWLGITGRCRTLLTNRLCYIDANYLHKVIEFNWSVPGIQGFEMRIS